MVKTDFNYVDGLDEASKLIPFPGQVVIVNIGHHVHN